MKLRKKFFITIIIIIVLCSVIKIYHFVVINKVNKSIEKFKAEDNRYYFVNIKYQNSIASRKNILNKNIGFFMKSTVINDFVNTYYEYYDFNKNEKYSINLNNNQIYKDEIVFDNKMVLFNLPYFIEDVFYDNKISIQELFKIYYIIPVTYNDKICLKIVTKNEKTIVDKDTFLPVYSVINSTNSDDRMKNKIESIYEFDVGNVTDEDVLLPDLSGYEIIEN